MRSLAALGLLVLLPGCSRLETLLPVSRTVVAADAELFVRAAFPQAEPLGVAPALHAQGVWRAYRDGATGRSLWLQLALWPDAETARSRFFATLPAHLYTFQEISGGEAFAAAGACQVRYYNLGLILTVTEPSREVMVGAMEALRAAVEAGQGVELGEAVEPPEIELRKIYQGREAPLAKRACLVFGVAGAAPDEILFAGARLQPRRVEDGLYESCVEADDGEPTLRVAKMSGEIVELTLSEALARKVPVLARP